MSKIPLEELLNHELACSVAQIVQEGTKDARLRLDGSTYESHYRQVAEKVHNAILDQLPDNLLSRSKLKISNYIDPTNIESILALGGIGLFSLFCGLATQHVVESISLGASLGYDLYSTMTFNPKEAVDLIRETTQFVLGSNMLMVMGKLISPYFDDLTAYGEGLIQNVPGSSIPRQLETVLIAYLHDVKEDFPEVWEQVQTALDQYSIVGDRLAYAVDILTPHTIGDRIIMLMHDVHTYCVQHNISVEKIISLTDKLNPVIPKISQAPRFLWDSLTIRSNYGHMIHDMQKIREKLQIIGAYLLSTTQGNTRILASRFELVDIVEQLRQLVGLCDDITPITYQDIAKVAPNLDAEYLTRDENYYSSIIAMATTLDPYLCESIIGTKIHDTQGNVEQPPPDAAKVKKQLYKYGESPIRGLAITYAGTKILDRRRIWPALGAIFKGVRTTPYLH